MRILITKRSIILDNSGDIFFLQLDNYFILLLEKKLSLSC